MPDQNQTHGNRAQPDRTHEDDEAGLAPIGAEGARLKQKITDDKSDAKAEAFDPGMSMLGTDNEAGAMPDPDGMATARNASKP